MMKLMCCALLSLGLLSPLWLEHRADAQELLISPPKKVVKYKKSFEALQKKANAVLSGKAFEDNKFKEKKTGKVVKYGDLPEFAQKVVQINVIEKLTKELTGIYDEWKEDLDGLKNGEEEKLWEKEEDVANFTDVTHYRDKLLTLRKEVAVKYEATATSFFDKFSEKFTKEESQGYLSQMKRYHDTHKLVERKK